MSVEIPTQTGLPFFDLQADLDGATYTLQFRWNVRAAGWYMTVLDEQGITLYLGGVRLVADFAIGKWLTGRQPPGIFVAVDTSGEGRDPGLNDLGARVRLIYFTEAEAANG